MSIYDQIVLQARSKEESLLVAKSLAHTHAIHPITILLSGELGAGKTTCVQEFARTRGILAAVSSPTFALEQRIGDITHIDLYRLTREEAEAFMNQSDWNDGIRIIEWPERLRSDYFEHEPTIHIRIEESNETERTYNIHLNDLPIPEEDLQERWMNDVCLPTHIRVHMALVARVAQRCAEVLLARNILVRTKALQAAALLHDLLRFVDFKPLPTPFYSPSEREREAWQHWKEQFSGLTHEKAAARFLAERGYRGIGEIIATHGAPKDASCMPVSTEQKILAYSDKRVRFDSIVSIDERFDDFLERFGDGKTESEVAKAWRQNMKDIERELFGGDPLKEI